jgi:hypothetical protein
MGVKNYYAKSKLISLQGQVARVDRDCNLTVSISKLECDAYKVVVTRKNGSVEVKTVFYGFKVDGVLRLSGSTVGSASTNESVAYLEDNDHKKVLVIQSTNGSGAVEVVTLGKRFKLPRSV